MNRVRCSLIALLAPCLLFAQQPYYYIWSMNADYEPHEKRTFEPGDSISVTTTSEVDLQLYIPGSKRIGPRRKIALGLSGTFEISEFFNQKVKQADSGSAGKGLTQPGATGFKATEETTASVISGIAQFLLNPDKPFFGCGTISAKRGQGSVTVANQSRDVLCFDIIWVQDGRCLSALSFAEDFLSGCVLAPGETYELKINSFAERHTLYLIATHDPFAYNKIDFSKYRDLPDTPSGTFSLSIVKVKD